MKKVLMAVLVVGLMTASANAVSVGLQWTDNPGDPYMEAADSATVWIDVYVTLQPSEYLTLVQFANLPVPELVQMSTEPIAPGFVSQSVDGPLGDGTTAVGFFSGTAIHGPWEGVIGRYDIHVSGGPSATYQIAFDHSTTYVTDDNGAEFIWDSRYFMTPYPGYISYGDYGNPGWWGTIKGAEVGQHTADPLTLHVIPEPGSLALLALGGLALLRRR